MELIQWWSDFVYLLGKKTLCVSSENCGVRRPILVRCGEGLFGGLLPSSFDMTGVEYDLRTARLQVAFLVHKAPMQSFSGHLTYSQGKQDAVPCSFGDLMH